jgi:hypothetical protein
LSPPVGYPLHLGNKNCYYKLFNFLLSTTLFKSLFTHSFSHFLSFSFSISLFLLVSRFPYHAIHHTRYTHWSRCWRSCSC